PEAACPKILRGLEQSHVESLERDVDRKDHERQFTVNLSDQNRQVVVEQLQRRSRKTHRHERRIHQALASEKKHPRVRSNQKARPERNHHKHQQNSTPSFTRLQRDEVRNGIAHNKTQRRSANRYPDRPPIGGQIERVERLHIIRKAERVDRPSVRPARRQTHDDDDHQRRNQQYDQTDNQGDDQTCAPLSSS